METEINMKNYAYGSELIKSFVNGYKVVSFTEQTGEGRSWVSQCLDFNVKGRGKTSEAAITDMLERMPGDPTALEKAPQSFYDLWDSEEVLVA